MIRKDVWEKIFELLIGTFADLTNRKELANFFDSFFTPTEKIMFAKRLAVSVMLAKKQDYRTIRSVLRVSPETISRMSQHLKFDGGLVPVVNKILTKNEMKVFWEELKSVFDLPTKGSTWVGWEKRKHNREKFIRQLNTQV
jgi:uncharacterized protein YerC